MKKEEMFDKLVEKTREVGRQVTFSEVNEDPRMPMANDYAYYYRSFTDAAKDAYLRVKAAERVTKTSITKG